MLPPKVTAYELYSKAGLTVCDIQIIVGKGCPCYNSADGEQIYKISDIDTENNIPFEDIQYPNEYVRKQDVIIDKLAYAEFLTEDFLNYLSGIFGIQKAACCRSSLELPDQEQRSLDVPFTLAAGPAPSLGIAEVQGQIANLKRQLEEVTRERDEARQEIEVLANRVEELEAMQGKASKTAPGREKAQDKRVEKWKDYAVVMTKVAYDCGVGDREGMTRPQYETLTARHGELSGVALDLLRDALPKEVTNTTGGASKQG